jgi:hypothetical protein
MGAAFALLLFFTLPGIPRARAAGPEKVKDKTASKPSKNISNETRFAIIQRAQVWMPTTIPDMDLRLGPQGKGAFAPNAAVTCDYVEQKLEGSSPKFDCRLDDGTVVKVKYGPGGEVQGEILSTRLLWALGFGADHMYPVVLTCRGCSSDPWTKRKPTDQTHVFDLAVIERKAPGHAVETKNVKGWSWREIDMINRTQGGAPIEQRDALKLLAVFIQHSDSKPEQQRLVCLGHRDDVDLEGNTVDGCAKSFMLINDLGQTFGKANFYNRSNASAVNFDGWSKAKVWASGEACVGGMSKSSTGTLDRPKISEAGRAFLAGLLSQLSDRQLRDLFEVSRVDLRSRKPGSSEPPASIDEWVDAFKHKRDEILTRRCPA